MLFILVLFLFSSGFAACVINHHNCDYDTNCGFTCDGVYQRELAASGMSFNQSHYDDFMSGCMQYYFPGGCGSSGSGSSSGSSSEVETVSMFSLSGFMIGFAAISIAYFVSVPLRVAVRALRIVNSKS